MSKINNMKLGEDLNKNHVIKHSAPTDVNHQLDLEFSSRHCRQGNKHKQILVPLRSI